MLPPGSQPGTKGWASRPRSVLRNCWPILLLAAPPRSQQPSIYLRATRNAIRTNNDSEGESMQWRGVMPAMTTAFDEALKVDHAFVARHARWLLANGCTGIVCLGSLGEAPTLTFAEKIAVVKTVVSAVSSSIPVIGAVSSLSTTEAVELARALFDAGVEGLMILPPYVYKGDWRESRAHIAAILKATPLEAMLYNNPIAYGTDFIPEHVADLAHEF